MREQLWVNTLNYAYCGARGAPKGPQFQNIISQQSMVIWEFSVANLAINCMVHYTHIYHKAYSDA